MVTKVFNPFFFISIICDLNFVNNSSFRALLLSLSDLGVTRYKKI